VSKDNPLKGPIPLSALGVEAPATGAGLAPLVKPYWLNMTDPVAANCTSCTNNPLYTRQANQPMFVYTELCFGVANQSRVAVVGTNSGPGGPTDTTLFVFNEEGTVKLWDDNSNTICGDGSLPSDANCPRGLCHNRHERCPPGVQSFSLSRVNLPVPAGVPSCYQVAIGNNPDDEKVANVGIDVLMDYEGVMPLSSALCAVFWRRQGQAGCGCLRIGVLGCVVQLAAGRRMGLCKWLRAQLFLGRARVQSTWQQCRYFWAASPD
jgi:hypothetical protein